MNFSDDTSFEERFGAFLPKLLKNQAFRKDVTSDLGEGGPAIVAALRAGEPIDEDLWDDLEAAVVAAFSSHSRRIVTLDWDSGSPMGGDGFSAIVELAGVYVFESSDWESEGPFGSLDEALAGNESFSMSTPAGANLNSEVLSRKKLIEIASGVVDWENKEPIYINGEKFAVNGRKLQPAESQAVLYSREETTMVDTWHSEIVATCNSLGELTLTARKRTWGEREPVVLCHLEAPTASRLVDALKECAESLGCEWGSADFAALLDKLPDDAERLATQARQLLEQEDSA